MSRESLTTAYRRGAISRRQFVRGLTSLGLTMTAATQIADRAAAAPEPSDFGADDVYGNEIVADSSAEGAPIDTEDPDAPEGDDNESDDGESANAPGYNTLANELLNVSALPNSGIGHSNERSRATTVLGFGTAIAAAGAIGVRRRRSQPEPVHIWPGWVSSEPASSRSDELPALPPKAE
jgi:hypothetical protein